MENNSFALVVPILLPARGPVTQIPQGGRAGRLASRIRAPMGPISNEIEIDLPREQVFAVLADLSRRPSFTDHFLTGFHLLRIDPVGEGAGARFRAQGPLRSPWMDTTIVSLKE